MYIGFVGTLSKSVLAGPTLSLQIQNVGKAPGACPCYRSSSVAPAHLPLMELSGPQHLCLENGTAAVPTFRAVVRSNERKHAREQPGTV